MSKDASLKLTGDWKRAGIYLKNLSTKLTPAFQAQFYEDGEFVLDVMKSHIINQDLSWTPLAERTIELKGGDDTIYIETGRLLDGLTVRRIKSSNTGSTIFVGASPWKTHKNPRGAEVKMSDLMIWLEYGTDKMPPRPLIQPTYNEVSDLLHKHWKELMTVLVKES